MLCLDESLSPSKLIPEIFKVKKVKKKRELFPGFLQMSSNLINVTALCIHILAQEY